MEKLNEYLQSLLSTCSYELHLEPNKTPYLTSDKNATEIARTLLLGTQISMLIFPLIPNDVKQHLPNKQEIEFAYQHPLGNFSFTVKKSAAGFIVTIRPVPADFKTQARLTSMIMLPKTKKSFHPRRNPSRQIIHRYRL